MILAEWTSQIAAVASHRQNHTPRAETCQGFLFNRIQSCRRDPSVVSGHDSVVFAYAPAAEANAAFRDMAVSETDVTNCCFTHA